MKFQTLILPSESCRNYIYIYRERESKSLFLYEVGTCERLIVLCSKAMKKKKRGRARHMK